jgi:membrane protein implicated in regulation of membrane protease activity
MGVAPFVWALLGVLLMAAELLTPGFWIVFFGAGGLVTAGLTWILPGLASRPHLQVLAWLGSSSLLLGLLRRALQRRLGGNGAGADDAVGMQAVVVEAIAPGRPGRIRLRGTTWRADGYDEEIAEGEPVEILAREGLTYYVCRPLLKGDAP